MKDSVYSLLNQGVISEETAKSILSTSVGESESDDAKAAVSSSGKRSGGAPPVRQAGTGF
jgi:hypothetical protein